jgi:hypothetical protein
MGGYIIPFLKDSLTPIPLLGFLSPFPLYALRGVQYPRALFLVLHSFQSFIGRTLILPTLL